MKYAVVLGDGMADYPIPELGAKTPLQAAHTPNFDRLSKTGEVGLALTVPAPLKPGSDVANLSVLGYDPARFYSGRSPLEAVSIGIDLAETDVTLRCNLVTLSDEENYRDKTMIDYSAGEISTEEAGEIMAFLAQKFNDERFEFHAGISYRHCLVFHGGEIGHSLTPPHDISDRPVANYLPKGAHADVFLDFMTRSAQLLKDHPVNLRRVAEGKRPANSIWLWGEGTKPALENFTRKTGLKGGVISAVDLIKGIGMLAGMKIIDVPDITGNYNTNFEGKARAALRALTEDGLDFVYIHMEAPDECGHQGDLAHKIYSVEQVDKVAGILADGLEKAGEPYKILVCPDHPTPVSLKTHVSDPVPYLICAGGRNLGGAPSYDEQSAKNSGIYVAKGWDLLDRMLHI